MAVKEIIFFMRIVQMSVFSFHKDQKMVLSICTVHHTSHPHQPTSVTNVDPHPQCLTFPIPHPNVQQTL